MKIELPENWEPFLRERVESGRYASVTEVLDEALHLLLERDQESSAADLPGSGRGDGDGSGSAPPDDAARQLQNLDRLFRTLDAMPSSPATDGLTNRDHDRILYGGEGRL